MANEERLVEALPRAEREALAGLLRRLLHAQVPKLSAAAVAEAIVGGLRRDRDEIRVGPVRRLAPLARLAPRLADRIVTRALTPAQPEPR
jgi:hypothetical protein